jgi:hypothetical protein
MVAAQARSGNLIYGNLIYRLRSSVLKEPEQCSGSFLFNFRNAFS